MTALARGTSRPGDGLLHPVALGSLVVLVVNDQLLKGALSGPVTGKLSDFAGLIVTPLALQAGWEVTAWALGRWSGPSRRVLATSIVVVAVAFAASQVWSPANETLRFGLAVVQWPFAAVAALVGGSPLPPLRPVNTVADWEDLLALPVVAITWWVGTQRASWRGARPRVHQAAPGRASGETP